MKRNEMLLAAFIVAVIALGVYLSTSTPPSPPKVVETKPDQKKDVYSVHRSVRPTYNSSAFDKK